MLLYDTIRRDSKAKKVSRTRPAGPGLVVGAHERADAGFDGGLPSLRLPNFTSQVSPPSSRSGTSRLWDFPQLCITLVMLTSHGQHRSLQFSATLPADQRKCETSNNIRDREELFCCEETQYTIFCSLSSCPSLLRTGGGEHPNRCRRSYRRRHR